MYLDSHCHLNDEHFQEDGSREEAIRRAKEAGISLFLVIGWDVPSSKLAVEIAESHEGIYAAVGIHPENLDGVGEEDFKAIKELSSSPKVVAIGEIGLDYHFFKDPEVQKKQQEWFIRQIDLANELGLPVSIHARDASQAAYQILKEHPIQKSAVLHCYSGSPEMLGEYAKLGLYFGFDGPITYKNAVAPKESVKACPLDRILSETDSPYLPPVPHRGERNEPSYIPLIVSQMAALKGISIQEMAKAIEENFHRLFLEKHRG